MSESEQTPSPTPSKQRKPVKTHLNARNNVVDPTKPCKRPKDEIIARELAKGANKVNAVMKAYPKASYNSARTMTGIIEQRGLERRALHILAEQGMTEGDLFKSLKECVLSDDERIKLDGTKHALGLIGYGRDSKESSQSYNPTQINIIIKQRDAQPVDSIEVTPIE